MHTDPGTARTLADTKVWVLDLARIRDYIRNERALLRLLAPSENARADRLPSGALRDCYIAAHVGLRRILLTLCGSQAASREFVLGRAGKPFLPGGPQFNLSRSGALALVAVSDKADVGIDIERIRTVAITDWAVRYPALQFFADHGVNMPFRLLQAWTRLEAWCKRRGLPVGRLLDLSDPRGLYSEAKSETGPFDGELRNLAVSPEYLACCACDEHSQLVVEHFI